MSLDTSTIQTREDFVAFVRDLRLSLEKGERFWENTDLDTYLDVMAHWVEERLPEMLARHAMKLPGSQDWQAFAFILSVAAMYE